MLLLQLFFVLAGKKMVEIHIFFLAFDVHKHTHNTRHIRNCTKKSTKPKWKLEKNETTATGQYYGFQPDEITYQKCSLRFAAKENNEKTQFLIGFLVHLLDHMLFLWSIAVIYIVTFITIVATENNDFCFTWMH